jgi:hypothetical protein
LAVAEKPIVDPNAIKRGASNLMSLSSTRLLRGLERAGLEIEDVNVYRTLSPHPIVEIISAPSYRGRMVACPPRLSD